MRVAEIKALLDARFDPAWAEPWDRVGLVCGDPDAEVGSVLCAVDPVEAVVDEALASGVDLLVVHHPLLLSGVHSVAADSPKGRVLHRLIRHGVALIAAHTNADVPEHGTNDALARTVGLRDLEVLLPTDGGGLDKLVVFVPEGHADAVRAAVTGAGAGNVGDYDTCTYSMAGEGRFRPLPGADPAIGAVGEVETVPEVRIETVVPRGRRRDVVAALRAAHPYEEPAFDLVALLDPPGRRAMRGHGRIGDLPEPITVEELAALVAERLPSTAHGVRVAGDPHRVVRRVAVGAGSGESLLETARAAGADAFLTSDLKHHRLSEFLEEPGAPAVLDVAHWAAEWTWLPVLAEVLTQDLAAAGATVGVRVSTLVTDPWTFRN